LFDAFSEYVDQCKKERLGNGGKAAVFPCQLQVIKDFVFNKSGPIVMGVEVKSGILKVGTPVCVPDKENMKIGVIESIQKNKKVITSVKVGD